LDALLSVFEFTILREEVFLLVHGVAQRACKAKSVGTAKRSARWRWKW
jgi:hypothetical protein